MNRLETMSAPDYRDLSIELDNDAEAAILIMTFGEGQSPVLYQPGTPP